MLARWDHCGRDSVLCVISPREARDEYEGLFTQRSLAHLSDDGAWSYRVVGMAQHLFSEYKRAAAIDEAIRPAEQERASHFLSVEAWLRFDVERQTAKTAGPR